MTDDYLRVSDGALKLSTTPPIPTVKGSNRFFYCDTTLYRNVGHFANTCRHLTSEARTRGMETHVYTYIRIDPALCQELQATPLFRHSGWLTCVTDPLSGLLEAFFLVGNSMGEDMARLHLLHQFTAGDTIYINSARAGELLGVIDWISQGFTPATCPRIVMEFGTNPGGTMVKKENGEMELQLHTLEGMLYRFATRRLPDAFRSRLVLATYEENSTRDYTAILGMPAETLPLPQPVDRPLGSRAARSPRVVSFLGHQRYDKGYTMAPGLVRHILANYPDVQVLVHNGAVAEMANENADLSALAENSDRLHMMLVPADGELWQQLLDVSALIVLPYLPERFTNAYSAVLAESASQGIPVITTEGTTMAQQVRTYANFGEIAKEWTEQSVAAAIDRALGNFDALADRAVQAATLWRMRNGPRAALNAILGENVVIAKN